MTFNKKQKGPVVGIFAVLLVRFISKGFGVSVLGGGFAACLLISSQLSNFGGWFHLIIKQKASKRMAYWLIELGKQ